MAVRSEESPVPPTSLVPVLESAGLVESDGKVIGLVRADGGAFGLVLPALPQRRLEVEARLPTQHWSSPEVIPGMVELEAPRLWPRLRRHLPAGWRARLGSGCRLQSFLPVCLSCLLDRKRIRVPELYGERRGWDVWQGRG